MQPGVVRDQAQLIYSGPGDRSPRAGCHDDRGREANENTLAMARAATFLNTPVASREVINFRDQLQPIVAAKCMGCHQPTFNMVMRDSMAVVDTIAAAGNLDLRMDAVTDTVMNVDFPRAYASLVGSMEVNMDAPGVLDPGFSRRSTLIDWVRGLVHVPDNGASGGRQHADRRRATCLRFGLDLERSTDDERAHAAMVVAVLMWAATARSRAGAGFRRHLARGRHVATVGLSRARRRGGFLVDVVPAVSRATGGSGCAEKQHPEVVVLVRTSTRAATKWIAT
jgi:hypothetical protein